MLQGDGELPRAGADPRGLALIAAGRLDPATVTSAVAGFHDADTALADPPTKLELVP